MDPFFNSSYPIVSTAIELSEALGTVKRGDIEQNETDEETANFLEKNYSI